MTKEIEVVAYYTVTVTRKFKATSYEDAETQAWDNVPYPEIAGDVTAADCEVCNLFEGDEVNELAEDSFSEDA